MTYGIDLERMGDRPEVQGRTYGIPDLIDLFIPELDDPSTFGADQMVVVGHSGGKLVMSALTLKPVFGQNAALRQEFQGRIDRGPRDPIAGGIHEHIQFIGRKMVVPLGDPIQHPGAFLRVSVLLFPEIIGEVLF